MNKFIPSPKKVDDLDLLKFCLYHKIINGNEFDHKIIKNNFYKIYANSKNELFLS